MVKHEIRLEIEKAAAKYGLDPDYVEAHVMTESSGNPKATRYEPAFYSRYVVPLKIKDEKEAKCRATSFGLLQIMGQVAREMGFKGEFKDLCGVIGGLDWGCRKLAKCYEKFGKKNINAGIAAYNCGTPKITPEGFKNQEYVNRVNGFLKKIKEG